MSVVIQRPNSDLLGTIKRSTLRIPGQKSMFEINSNVEGIHFEKSLMRARPLCTSASVFACLKVLSTQDVITALAQ